MSEPTTYDFTDATRYICAAIHWYPDLRKRIFQKIIGEEHKAPVEALGVDLLTVVKHYIHVREQSTRLLLLRSLFTILVIMVIILRLLFQVMAHPSSLGDLLLGSIICIVLSFFGAWITVLIETWNSDRRVVAHRFTPEKFRSMSIAISLKPGLETKIRDAQEGNVVIYSHQAKAFFIPSSNQEPVIQHNPFVGLGWRMESCRWLPHAIACDRGKQEMGTSLTPQPFTLEEFYRSLSDKVQENFGSGLSVRDRLYVDGQRIQNDPTFLPDDKKRPRTRVDYSLVRYFMEYPSDSVAFYQCFHLIHPSGNLIFSLCLHCNRDDRGFLNIHQEGFLLSPPGDRYSAIDIENTLKFRDGLAIVWESLRRTPQRWRDTPRDCFKFLSQKGKGRIAILWKSLRKMSHEHFGFLSQWEKRHADTPRRARRKRQLDFGALSSLRFDVCSSYNASNRASKFFHQVNMEAQINKLMRSTRQAIIDFLDSKQIDTSLLSDSQAQSFFFNADIIIEGGEFNGDNYNFTGQLQQPPKAEGQSGQAQSPQGAPSNPSQMSQSR